jgi:glycosyltransferase involved in cell wall biosynthesis
MKIAMILPSLTNLGPVVVAHELVKGLSSLPEVSEIDVYYFDEREPEKNLHFPARVQKISFFEKLDLSDYDVIHSHGIRPDMFLAYHKIRNRRLAVVATMHCYIYPELAQTYNKLIATIATPFWLYILRPFNKVVFLSADMMRHYSRHFRKSQLSYIYNYRDPRQINTATLSEKEQKEMLMFKGEHVLLGTICKLTRRKGVHQLIELLAVDPKYRLIIVGDGKELQNLIKLAEDTGVADRCLFTGFKNNAVAYLPLIDIFCLASNSEGFGLVLLEAALAKKSIVCTDLASFRELFSDNEVAFFKYRNIESLNSAVANASKNTREHGELAYQKTLAAYNKDNFINGYISVYRDLVHKSRVG